MFLTYWSCSLYPIRFIKAYYSLYKNRARLFLLPALVWLNWFEWNKKGSWWPKDKGLVPYLYKVPCFLCIASYFSVTRDPPDNSLSWEIFVTTFPRQLIEEGFCERSSDYDIKLTTVVQNLYTNYAGLRFSEYYVYKKRMFMSAMMRVEWNISSFNEWTYLHYCTIEKHLIFVLYNIQIDLCHFEDQRTILQSNGKDLLGCYII